VKCKMRIKSERVLGEAVRSEGISVNHDRQNINSEKLQSSQFAGPQLKRISIFRAASRAEKKTDWEVFQEFSNSIREAYVPKR
jgi:hypothetical protein